MLNIMKRRFAVASLGLIAAGLLLGGIITAQASAYEGPFCNTYLSVGNGCFSSLVSNIRRAVGHGKDWTYIQIGVSSGAYKSASCTSDGCSADTGYLPNDPSATGKGYIANYGDPCSCGGGDYYGYLYP